jgi:hypothetical protein
VAGRASESGEVYNVESRNSKAGGFEKKNATFGAIKRIY